MHPLKSLFITLMIILFVGGFAFLGMHFQELWPIALGFGGFVALWFGVHTLCGTLLK